MNRSRALAICFFVATAWPAGAAPDAAVVDLAALNACIEAGVERGDAWTRSPVEVLNHLFSLAPDCVLAKADTVAPAASADTTVTLVFRHALPRRLAEGAWLQAEFAPADDGSWRIRRLDRHAAALARVEADRRESSRLLGISISGFDTAKRPLDLLEFLGHRRGGWMAPLFPRGWIKESDLPALMALVDSPEPCANVINMVSSVYDTTDSTIGNEAAYLVEGFREGRYPPRLVSNRPPCDVRALKAWWAERTKP